MPSKAAVVAEQSAPVSSGSGRNSVTDSTNETSSLSQQVYAILQHKCRNLEKRKKKLDDYKKVDESKLKADQREALSHFGEVVQLIDLVTDLRKQFESTFSDQESLLKRQAKAERNVQRKRDLGRMRDSLDIKFVLNNICDETARATLLESGKVSEAELVLLTKFYETVEPTLSACSKGKRESFLFKATDCFERVLRREEKPFVEKHTYAEVFALAQRVYQSLVEQSNETVETVETVKVAEPVEEPTETVETTNNNNHHVEAPVENNVPSSPQKQQQQQPQHNDKSNTESVKNNKQQNQQQAKLDEIVKPGSFSFLQESQISFNNRAGAVNHEFNNDQQIGQWVPQQSPGKREQENRNNSGHAETGNTEHHQGGRNQRGGRQNNRNRKPHYNQSGGADENNESGQPGWPQNDADYSQWKPDDASGNQREGAWIGQEPRRRPQQVNGGNTRGRGNFRGNSNQQFGDNNKRHSNRGPRAPTHQNRTAPVGSNGYAE